MLPKNPAHGKAPSMTATTRMPLHTSAPARAKSLNASAQATSNVRAAHKRHTTRSVGTAHEAPFKPIV